MVSGLSAIGAVLAACSGFGVYNRTDIHAVSTEVFPDPSCCREKIPEIGSLGTGQF
jgi:hypothetical protein